MSTIGGDQNRWLLFADFASINLKSVCRHCPELSEPRSLVRGSFFKDLKILKHLTRPLGAAKHKRNEISLRFGGFLL